MTSDDLCVKNIAFDRREPGIAGERPSAKGLMSACWLG